jgi:hypothetical protein
MRIAACPDPDCGAPAEITPWAVAASTSGPVPHVRTLCVNKHRYLLPDTWVRSHDTRPVSGPSATTTTNLPRPIRLACYLNSVVPLGMACLCCLAHRRDSG